MSVFKTIICSINLIEHSDDIVYYTKELAKQNGATVLVVHVMPSIDVMRSYFTSTAMAENLIEDAKNKAQAFINEFVAKNFQGVSAEAIVISGNASHELLDLADRRCADIIIMGSMSTKGISGFFSPKSSQSLIGKTRIPVMVIPNDLDMECTPE